MQRNKFLPIILSAMVILLSSCASIVNGTHQNINVHTTPVGGAVCTLENNKGRWILNRTPGSVTVARSFHDLRINCSKKGYRHGFAQVNSKTKAMAFGNIIFGGIIGAGVDVADGAAYDYPNDIFVNLEERN